MAEYKSDNDSNNSDTLSGAESADNASADNASAVEETKVEAKMGETKIEVKPEEEGVRQLITGRKFFMLMAGLYLHFHIRAQSSNYCFLEGLWLAVFLSALDMTVVATAMPRITSDLNGVLLLLLIPVVALALIQIYSVQQLCMGYYSFPFNTDSISTVIWTTQ